MKNKWIRVSILMLNTLALGLSSQAQRPVGTWKAYMAYHNAALTAETPHKAFAVYDGSLLSYSFEDEEVKTYSVTEGLSDVGIKCMAYSTDMEVLVLVYDNSNIDLYMGENKIYNLPYITNDEFIQDKTVNNLELIGNYAYLSTAFGIVVVDLQRKEIKDTYKLGVNTQSVCTSEQYIYAATSDGVLRALLSSNLLDKNNWKDDFQLSYGGDDTKIKKILFFKESFVFYQPDAGVYYQDGQGTNHLVRSGIYRQVEVISNQLVLNGTNYLGFFSDFSSESPIYVDAGWISANNSQNKYWLAQGEKGLVGITKQANVNDYTVIMSGIQVNSPKRNLTYFLTYSSGKLLITGGGRGVNRNNNPGTLMVLENGNWFNFDETDISQSTGLECMDFMSAIVDPRDPNHYFVSSWGEGVYEFKDNAFVKLHSTNNSTLETAVPGSAIYIRVDGLAYDKDNNLYVTNSEVKDAVQILSSANEWTSLYYSDVSGLSVISQQVLVSRSNQKWVNLPFGKKVGILVLDETNNQMAFSSRFVDQQGTDIKAASYPCMAEDLNGTIWVGTDNGPILFNNADQVKNGTCTRIIMSGEFNGYYLLDGEKITTIAVDGGNRKWIGTTGSGVFLVTQDGENITVDNFTTKNSDLLSDNILSIAIHGETGEVFIGTDKGLVSYMGDATTGKPDYSNVYVFPNPVRPANNSQVIITGLMKDSNVKITDLAGNLIVQGTSSGGQFSWNCTGRNGATVKSGIYLVFGSTPDGSEGMVTKFMVIK